MDASDKKWLKGLFGKNVIFNEIMAKRTSLKVGGPADVFIEPENQNQLIDLVGWLGQKNFPYLVVGEGTNLLVKDKGIRAVVISLLKCVGTINRTEEGKGGCRVDVMAGVPLKRLCRYSLNNGLSGMNFALGIPGTIGGAIKMNAGTPDGEMKDVLDSIEILLPDGNTQTLDKKQLKFSSYLLHCKIETWGCLIDLIRFAFCKFELAIGPEPNQKFHSMAKWNHHLLSFRTHLSRIDISA